MKLLRWAVAGASVFVVYRYSIGRKAKGDDVLASPEDEIAKLEGKDLQKNTVVDRSDPKKSRA